MLKTIINSEGYIVDFCVKSINGILKDYELKVGEQVVERYIPTKDKNFVKPKWNGSAWIECATEEEIKVWQEVNTITEKEPTEQEKLNSTLLQQNAEIQLQLDEQKQLNATLLKEIADIKGGSTNV